MKLKFALALIAAFGFAALPAFAQHGHGGGGGGASSMHGGSHSSGHDANEANEANEANDDHGHDATAEANEHSGSHGGHDSSHGGLTGKLSRNTQLANTLQGLLPAGTNLQQAASGFKNLKDFAAAVNAAHDLGISFDQLKAKMTGPGAENLRKAIADLDPSANAKAAAKQAEQEAKSDIKSADNDDKNAAPPPAPSPTPLPAS
jgi:hypothetical protein